MLQLFGWFGDFVQYGNPKEHEPQNHLQTVRFVEPRSSKLQDMFEVFKAFFNFKTVIVNPNYFGSTTAEVVGQNVPWFIVLTILWATDNP